MECADRPARRLATRLAFVVAGFGIADTPAADEALYNAKATGRNRVSSMDC